MRLSFWEIDVVSLFCLSTIMNVTVAGNITLLAYLWPRSLDDSINVCMSDISLSGNSYPIHPKLYSLARSLHDDKAIHPSSQPATSTYIDLSFFWANAIYTLLTDLHISDLFKPHLASRTGRYIYSRAVVKISTFATYFILHHSTHLATIRK